MSHPSDVSGPVGSIVQAFVDGINILGRIRSRRAKKQQRDRDLGRDAEQEQGLRRSLAKGHTDVKQEYERSFGRAGKRFAVGDGKAYLTITQAVLIGIGPRQLTCWFPETAHAALVNTLLRLNTGLVDIIQSFLDKRRASRKLDYSRLTRLSDDSRRETIDVLHQLHQRLSRQHMLQPSPPSTSERRKRKRSTSRVLALSGAAISGPGRSRSSSKSAEPEVVRVAVKGSSEPKLAVMVRHGNKSSKAGPISSRGTKTRGPSPHGKKQMAKGTERDQPPHAPRMIREGPNPIAMPGALGNYPPAQPHMLPAGSWMDVPSVEVSTPEQPFLAPTLARPLPPGSAPAVAGVPRRRSAKQTPTFFSIASTGTKLGEIPLHKWTQPFDFDEMERLNKEAEVNGWPLPVPATEGEKKPKFSFLRVFKKGK